MFQGKYSTFNINLDIEQRPCSIRIITILLDTPGTGAPPPPVPSPVTPPGPPSAAGNNQCSSYAHILVYTSYVTLCNHVYTYS